MKPAVVRRLYSLIFIRDLANNKVLLGFKKRGLGMNKWTGLGGKVEPNESLHDCAIREAKEECGLEIEDVKHTGCVEFQFENNMNEILEVHVFCADKFRGELQECDEILPQWFDMDKLPYEKMWKDGVFWHPFMFDNKLFKAFFLFKEDQETILNYFIEEIESL